MFLFTTPPASAGRDAATGATSTGGPAAATRTGARAAGQAPVVEAIRDGAARTGAGFDYLLATAQRESALDPRAKNGASSATGLFQFIEQTWLGTMKSDGPRLGLGDYAAQITARGNGSFAVGDAASRQAILDLRNDPGVASAMAGALTQRNRETLSSELGREPSRGELYAAHVLGARGASDLIQNAAADPTRPAATDLPAAAAANRAIFYDRGRARGAAEVIAALGVGQQGTEPAMPATAAPSFGPDRPLAYARNDGPVLHALFQTDARRGPISEGVARLWAARATPAATTALSYFPRSEGETPAPSSDAPAPAAAPVAAGAPAASAPLVDPPLPPRRPSEADLRAPAAAAGDAPRTTGTLSRAADASRARRSTPLDLAAFMRPNRT